MTLDQTKQSEDVQVGDVQNEAGTATAEEKGIDLGAKEEGTSIESIMSATEDDNVKKSKAGTDPGVQRRIDKIVSEKKALEHKLAEMERLRSIPREKPVVPDRDDFDSKEDYQKAWDKYHDEITAYTDAMKEGSKVSDTYKRRLEESSERYEEQLTGLKNTFPDIEDVVSATDYGNAQQAISFSKHNLRIAYYLSQNPKELEKIKTMDNDDVLKEIGKLELKCDGYGGSNKTKTPSPLNIIKNPVDDNVDSLSISYADSISKKYLGIK